MIRGGALRQFAFNVARLCLCNMLLFRCFVFVWVLRRLSFAVPFPSWGDICEKCYGQFECLTRYGLAEVRRVVGVKSLGSQNAALQAAKARFKGGGKALAIHRNLSVRDAVPSSPDTRKHEGAGDQSTERAVFTGAGQPNG